MSETHCARCSKPAVTRVRYQTHREAMDVCAEHDAQFQDAARAAGLRLVYDDGAPGGDTATEARLSKLEGLLTEVLLRMRVGNAPTVPATPEKG